MKDLASGMTVSLTRSGLPEGRRSGGLHGRRRDREAGTPATTWYPQEDRTKEFFSRFSELFGRPGWLTLVGTFGHGSTPGLRGCAGWSGLTATMRSGERHQVSIVPGSSSAWKELGTRCG